MPKARLSFNGRRRSPVVRVGKLHSLGVHLRAPNGDPPLPEGYPHTSRVDGFLLFTRSLAGSLASGLLLLLLLVLFRLRAQSHDLLDLLLGCVLRGEVAGFEGHASDADGSRWQEKEGELEVHDLVPLALVEHGVWRHKLMLLTLHDPHASLLLVLEGSQGEGQGGELAVHFVEEIAARTHLQAVVLVHSTLEDGGPKFGLAGLAVTSGNGNIHRVHLVQFEGEIIHLVLQFLLEDDHLVPVNHVALHLVGQGALDKVHFEVLRDLGPCLGHLLVRVAWADELGRHLGAHVPSVHEVAQLVTDRSLRRGGYSDSDRVPYHGNKAVDMNTKVDLHHISLLQRWVLVAFRLDGRVVADALVHRDAGWESNTLINLLGTEDGRDATGDHFIAKLAEAHNACPDSHLRHNTLESEVCDLARFTVLGADVAVGQVLLRLVVHDRVLLTGRSHGAFALYGGRGGAHSPTRPVLTAQ
mmetsp:Transcript_1478/g.4507  ORF Transcript_1478/g.4507 Transcript_1478/m.4507 type:complete len:470 (-) Transcript_1478:64-1473(-)